MTRPRDAEAGVVLVNVLVVIALAAGIVVLMLTTQEAAVDRTRLTANRAQAETLALGAETSLVVALRRDLIEAPATDHLSEDWARVIQSEVVLETGRFSVQIEDMRARFDLNRLVRRRVSDLAQFRALVLALGLPRDVALRVAAALVQQGPVADLDDLARVGVTDDQRAILAPHVVAAPIPGPVNLNTAGELVLAAVFDNTRVAGRLVRRRTRSGFLTTADLSDLGVVVPPGAAFTSDLFRSQVRTEVDGVAVHLTSLVYRRRAAGRQDAVVIGRAFGQASLPTALPSLGLSTAADRPPAEIGAFAQSNGDCVPGCVAQRSASLSQR